MNDQLAITFPAHETRVTWRDVRDVREGMIVYHGLAPNTLLLGRNVKLSLWTWLVCWVRFGLRIRRSR